MLSLEGNYQLTGSYLLGAISSSGLSNAIYSTDLITLDFSQKNRLSKNDSGAVKDRNEEKM